jgi:uncharacterized protein (DUF2062 family)
MYFPYFYKKNQLSQLRLIQFFERRLFQPLLGFLRQGITPQKLALTVALGVVCGLFPIVGSTTILCVVVALAFRLNMAVIQLINYFMAPVQLVLFIPFVQLGAWMFNTNPLPYTVTEVVEIVMSEPLRGMEMFWVAALLGIATWALFVLPVFAILYGGMYFLFKKFTSR